MKKPLLLICILCFSITSFSQSLSYGIVVGANYHDNEEKTPSDFVTPLVSNRPNIHVGAFVDYQVLKKFGVKLNVLYKRSFEKYRFLYSNSNSFTSEFNINSLQLAPHIKFDVETEYNKGFYLLAGPRFSFVLSAEDDFGIDVKNFYKGTNIAAQLGFGFNAFTHFALEFLGEYGFSDITESDSSKVLTAGGYINLNVNLESLLNKK